MSENQNAVKLVLFFVSFLFANEHLYGAWENVGTSDFGISGVIFITPNYAASLEKSKSGKIILKEN